MRREIYHPLNRDHSPLNQRSGTHQKYIQNIYIYQQYLGTHLLIFKRVFTLRRSRLTKIDFRQFIFILHLRYHLCVNPTVIEEYNTVKRIIANMYIFSKSLVYNC